MLTTDIQLPGDFHWFSKPSDVLRVPIVELERASSYFVTPGDALDRLFAILGGFQSAFTVQECEDFDQAPEADGWYEWRHVGVSHQSVGRRLYNWLRWKYPGGRVSFSDEPDFQVMLPDGMIINGDIGLTSASCFILSFLNLPGGSWWMSVSDDGRKHVIIVALHGGDISRCATR